MDEYKETDKKWMEELMKTELKTKDGRPELTVAELVTEEEDKVEVDDSDSDEDDDDDDYHFRDDSSSAVGTPGSSGFTPASSSGIPPVKKLVGPSSNIRLATEEGLENSIKTAAPPAAEEALDNTNSLTNLVCKGSVGDVDNQDEPATAEDKKSQQSKSKKEAATEVNVSQDAKVKSTK